MSFHRFLFGLSPVERRNFAERCGTSARHLENVARGYSTASPALAVAIERESLGAVGRQAMRPQDWRAIWPEMAETEESPV